MDTRVVVLSGSRFCKNCVDTKNINKLCMLYCGSSKGKMTRVGECGKDQ